MTTTTIRSRWAAVGAAVAVTLGAGGIGLVSATSPAGATAYVPIEPCRAADTRPEPINNVGPRNTPIGGPETHTVNADEGDCAGAIPAGASGLQLNVTAVDSTIASFLTIWASGERPTASSLNPTPGQPPVPNAVTTGITGAGDFNIYNNAGTVHVVVDIVGFYIDHHHDDRYYTETEIDAALAAKADAADVYTRSQVYTRTQVDAAIAAVPSPNAFGFVNEDGTLASEFGAVSSTRVSEGEYRVDLDSAFNLTSFAAAVTPACPGGFVSIDAAGGDLLVSITDGTDPLDCNFTFVVFEVS